MPVIPAGFRSAPASGLIVPEALSREREVWTEDEGRLLDRATKLLAEKGIVQFLKCPHPACTEHPIGVVRLDARGVILRCAHKDRVLQRAF
jgi:hypothetical protein